MSALSDEPVTCAFCHGSGDGFSLRNATCDTLSAVERAAGFGCPACLAAGRFTFTHNTEIGILDERGLRLEYANQHDAPAQLRADALETLLRTPDVLRWQSEPWLTHCNDFMAYIGTWQPSDFRQHAPDGDGRALFMRMTRDSELQHVWDEACNDGEAVPPEDWPLVYYAYRCLHCGELAGNWDCD